MALIEVRFLWLCVAHVRVIQTFLLLDFASLVRVDVVDVKSPCPDWSIGPLCWDITGSLPTSASMKLLNLLLKDNIVIQLAIYAENIIDVLNSESMRPSLPCLQFLRFVVFEVWLYPILFLRIWLKLLCRRHMFRLLFFLIFKILLKVHFCQGFVPCFQIIF